MKKKLLYIFSSNVKIRVSGRNINLFIKRLIKNNINVIRVIPVSYKEVLLIVDYNDIEKINRIKSIYKVDIVRYYGKLRLLRFIKKNIFIISFLIIGIIMIYILSNIIFSIDIIHSNSNIISLVDEELKSHGIKKYGFVKSYKEIENIKKEILEDNRDSLEWLEIIRSGTKYIVRVEERIINSDINSDNNYSIVAKKNAVIKSIIAYNGEKVKEVNSYVKKGEEIISSYVTMPNNEKVFSGANGKVIGEVWYDVSIDYPYYYNEVLYTGKKRKVISFNILSKSYSLFNFKKYKSFDINRKYIFKNSIIPISLSIDYEYETRVINDIYTYDTAKEKAIMVAKNKLMDKYKDIIDIDKVIIINESEDSSKIRLNLFVACNEDITEYKEVIEEDKNESVKSE